MLVKQCLSWWPNWQACLTSRVGKVCQTMFIRLARALNKNHQDSLRKILITVVNMRRILTCKNVQRTNRTRQNPYLYTYKPLSYLSDCTTYINRINKEPLSFLEIYIGRNLRSILHNFRLTFERLIMNYQNFSFIKHCD